MIVSIFGLVQSVAIKTVSHQTIFMNLKMILETKMIDMKGVAH